MAAGRASHGGEMKEYFADTMQILNDALDALDTDQFRKMVEHGKTALKNGGQIVATGLGKNVPICDKFVGTMLSLGMKAFFLHTNSAVHGDLGAVRDKDMVIILTKSGETSESIYLAEHLKKRDVDLWLLTFRKESALAKTIPNSLVLEMAHEGDMWDIVPNNSTTLNLIVLQGLAMHLAKEMGITLEDFKKNHPGGHIGVELKDI